MSQTTNHPNKLYHYTPSKHRASIQQRGLLTSMDQTGGDAPEEGLGCIYLIDLLEEGSGDIWEVDVTGLKLDTDTMWPGEGNAWISDKDIPPSRLKLLNKGK